MVVSKLDCGSGTGGWKVDHIRCGLDVEIIEFFLSNTRKTSLSRSSTL